MTRRICFLWILSWLVAGLPILLAAAERPNIVFLMADDQCCYTLGCYGNADVQTPNIDQIAADGIVFDNHYDTTAICMASRASVMTGMFEYKTGCNFTHGPLTQDKWQRSYPMLLRAAGYETAFAGKFGFEVVIPPPLCNVLCEFDQRENGPRHFDIQSDEPNRLQNSSPTAKNKRLPADDFDRWGGGPGQTSYETRKNKSMVNYADEYPHSTLSYGAFGRDFIRAAARSDKPFCLSISFKAPHRPATPDPRFNAVYAGKTFKKPDNFGREHGLHFSEQSRQGRQYERFYSWHYADQYDQVMAIYHQQVYGIDVAVGMIRKAIEEAGVKENTVLIYTSDNGFFCGSHGYGSKVLPYEEASRVPLIVYDSRHPNSGRRIRTDALTGNVDFAPTILALAGITPPRQMDGCDLMTIYNNPRAAIHEFLPLINVWGPAATHSLAVVTKDVKYIFWPYGADGMNPTDELYNTRNDPLELTNIVRNRDDHDTLTSMRERYDQQLAKWRREAVDYNDYQKFGVVFDHAMSWSEKVKSPARPPVKRGKSGRRRR